MLAARRRAGLGVFPCVGAAIRTTRARSEVHADMNAELARWRDDFLGRVGTAHYVEQLFDRLPDLVFSMKDVQGRYVLMSDACVRRCGLRSKRDAVGRTAFDLFPRPMADRYARQDERLFRTGRPIVDNLDLTVYRDGSHGWCITTKEPLRDREGRVIGLACISKDLVEPSRDGLIDAGLAGTVDYMLEHYALPLRTDQLARRAGLSETQFDRRMKKIFQLSATQYLIKTRIGHAARLLADTDTPIADVAQSAGFSDQSALARQFRQVMGYSPGEYRASTRR
jgi:PAS domain S-box-containing protein